MEQQDNIQLFEQMPIPRAVAKLAIPTVIGSLVMVLYSMADTYFVGMVNDPIQNAAVALASPVLLAFNAVNNLFGVGSSSMMSRALGRRDYEMAKKTSAFGFYCALASGLLFSLLCTIFQVPLLGMLGVDADTAEATAAYMHWTVTCGAAPAIVNVVMGYMVRSEGAAFHASVGTMSGCVLNMILDPIFILPGGLNMGAAGAGLATFLSNCVACMYFLVLFYIRRKTTVVCILPQKFRLQRAVVLGVCGVGIPAAIQNLLNVTGMTILNNFTSSYGADAVAAMGITQKINMLPVQIALGFSQGVMPLVSYNYASRNHKRMKESIRFVAGIMIPFLSAVAIGYYVGAGSLIRLFMDHEVIVGHGSRFLRGFCIAMPFMGLDFMTVGVFQAIGMGKAALTFAILRKIVLEIPAICILNQVFPLYGLAYAQFVAEFVLAIAAMVMLKRIFDGMKKDGAGIA